MEPLRHRDSVLLLIFLLILILFLILILLFLFLFRMTRAGLEITLPSCRIPDYNRG